MLQHGGAYPHGQNTSNRFNGNGTMSTTPSPLQTSDSPPDVSIIEYKVGSLVLKFIFLKILYF